MRRPALNHGYRLLWNAALGAFTVASEFARRRTKGGKRIKRSLALAAVAPVFALAAPSGGVVTSGAAVIVASGSTTNINQSSHVATINWKSFSTTPTETVNFNQPSASSVTLNRVVGNEASVLAGALNATGKVFLVNSAGVLISKGGTVNTAGFVASTLAISDADFNTGKYLFTANGSTGSVINQGSIQVAEGGYVALLGHAVSNQGVISATKGTVGLASGDRITLNLNGDSLVSLTVDEGTLNALVENKDAIYADGGTVILSAKAADSLLGSQVNNSGIIQARTLDDLKGSITLWAQGGGTTVSGTLDASAPLSGNGGFIETSGDSVRITDGALITTKAAQGATGTWLVDPDGFTIAANGGDISGVTLSALLNDNNISLASTMGNGTSGDIDVNAALSWSANTTLTLTATRDVNVNAAITATGDRSGLALNAGSDINISAPVTFTGANATLALNYGGYNGTTVTTAADGTGYNLSTLASYSGTVLDADGSPVAQTDTSGGVYGSITFSNDANTTGLHINGQGYTLIHDLSSLATTGTLSGFYALAEDLDASAWSAANLGAGSVVGTLDGTLAGLGHTVSHLSLSDTADSFLVGMVGQTSGASLLRDIGLLDVQISGGQDVGALVGYLGTGASTVSHCYVAGDSAVTGTFVVGGLVGNADTGSVIDYCQSNAVVIAGGRNGGCAGGLVGAMVGTLTQCSATGSVTLNNDRVESENGDIGGLVGHMSGDVSRCYAEGEVSACYGPQVGGLIGWDAGGGSVTDSFATGKVTGKGYVGGLIGFAADVVNYGTTNVTNCWASGDVTGTDNTSLYGSAGGLIGGGGVLNITDCHATGDVSNSNVDGLFSGLGGLVGFLSSGSITGCYATGDVVGNAYSEGVGGLAGLSGYGAVTGCYATGNVTGNADVGGLVGFAGASITDSYATGDVSGYAGIGGLVGGAADGVINNCYASGDVSGTWQVGGLAGWAGYLSIIDSHASGSVTGVDNVGGLLGAIAQGSVDNCYSSGVVTGSGENIGGLVGWAKDGESTISNTYWNSQGQGGKGVGTVEDGSSASVTDSRGLMGSQWNDLSHYQDGSIDQVLEERATVVSQAGANSGEAQQLQSRTTPPQESEVRGEAQGPSVEEQIVYADYDTYSTDLESISVDGVQFDLRDGSRRKSK